RRTLSGVGVGLGSGSGEGDGGGEVAAGAAVQAISAAASAVSRAVRRVFFIGIPLSGEHTNAENGLHAGRVVGGEGRFASCGRVYERAKEPRMNVAAVRGS